jgi:hypothetical protein
VRAGAALSLLLVAGAEAQAPQVEVGLENLYYRTTETPINRGNILGLDPGEDLLRASLNLKQSLGEARFVFRGYVEQGLGGTGNETRFEARQAYAQYAFGSGLQLRAGKQRVAWGSGFAWNPTNRLEPPKNPINTGLEQQGSLAFRMDVIPGERAGIVLVAAQGTTNVGDLPFPTREAERTTGAVRARFLVADTDLAFVYLGGKNQKTLAGFDLGRDVLGRVSLHAEGSFHRGSEIDPARPDETFFRVAAGALYAAGTSSASVEYFFNGEGQTDAENARYLRGLDAAFAASQDPRLPEAVRQQALERYLALAGVPFSGGMGLRRHYLQAAWSRSQIGGEWSVALRAAVGLCDGGVALTPGVAWTPRPDTSAGLDAVLLLGPQDSEYRLAPVKGAVQARVRVAF